MQAACISIRAASSDLECLLREADFSRRPAGAGRAARGAARRARHHQIQSRAPATGQLAIAAGPAAASSCRARSRTICRSVSGPGEVRTNLELLARFAPRTPTPSLYISRTPTCWPDTAWARCRRPRRDASPISSCPTARPRALLAIADELHTMTSLAGFEALLRGRRVVVYGRPFYAGWGLTADLSSHSIAAGG